MMKLMKHGKAVTEIFAAFTRADPGMPVIVSLRDSKRGPTTDYWVEHLPSDFGRAMRFRKFNSDENYDVLLDGGNYSCECMGFLHHGHCKHVETARLMIVAGAEPRSALRPELTLELPARKVNPNCCICGESYEDCRCEV